MATALISDSIKKKYDLSCPNPDCRSINNIHVAGVYEYKNKPEKWYCRCGTCGRSFSPRKRKEDNDKMATIMQTARKILPKEILGPLLAARKTNKEIGIEHGGLPHWAVSELKKEYWPKGFDPKEYMQRSGDGGMNSDGQQEAINQPQPLVTERPQQNENQYENQVKNQSEKAATEQSPGSNQDNKTQEDEPAVLDIHSLIKLKNALEDDLINIDRIYKLNRRLSSGVDKLLSQHRAQCTEKLELINKVFSNTMVTLEHRNRISDGDVNECSA